MLEWLKPILGEHWSEELDRQISAEIGKGFVARADYNAKTAALKTAQETLKGFEGVDVEALRGQITKLNEQLGQQAQAYAFDSALDGAIREARGRNLKAIRGMLDVDALRASKQQADDIKAALDKLAGENPWAFDSEGPTISTGGEHGRGLGGGDGVEAAFASLNPWYQPR